MTNQSRSGSCGDYFHALAIRVLREDRLLAPRRSSRFEDEFSAPADVHAIESLAPAESPRSEPVPSRAGDGQGGSLTPPSARPASAPPLAVPVEDFATPAAIVQPAAVAAPPPASVAEPRATARIAAVSANIEAPARHSVAEIAPRPMDAPVSAMRAPRAVKPISPPPTFPAPRPSRSSANPPASSAHSAAPQVIQQHFNVAAPPVSVTPVPSKPAPCRDLQAGALTARPIPEMRSLAPLFPVPHARKEPPPVEITIGRLEIRAAAAKVPAAEQRTTPVTPRHSLKEYLARPGGRS